MNILRRWLTRTNGYTTAEIAPKRNQDHMVDILSSPDNPATVTVTSIRNGFLLCSRTYNPNGPDRVEATYAADADDLATKLIGELTTRRLTNK